MHIIWWPNSELSWEFSDIKAVTIPVLYIVNTFLVKLLYALPCVDIAFCYSVDVISSFPYCAFKYI